MGRTAKPKAPAPKLARVGKNNWGNYRGFLTGQGWRELGCREFDAVAWLADRVDEGYTVHPQSYIIPEQVTAYKKRMGD